MAKSYNIPEIWARLNSHFFQGKASINKDLINFIKYNKTYLDDSKENM